MMQVQKRGFLQKPAPVSPRFSAYFNADQYATPLPGGNEYLALYRTQPTGYPHPWFFAHRRNAKGAVHSLTLVKNEKGEDCLHLLIQTAPSLDNTPVVQLPAGIWGDTAEEESALYAANREVKEETGYSVGRSQMLLNQPFVTSPGMTTETKYFALAKATGRPSTEFYDGTEHLSIIGRINLPLSIIRDYDKFTKWVTDVQNKEYKGKKFIVGMDVLAARALLPPQSKLKPMNMLA